MAKSDINVFGADEIRRMFIELPQQVNQDKIWNKFFKQISKPLISKAQSLAPKKLVN